MGNHSWTLSFRHFYCMSGYQKAAGTHLGTGGSNAHVVSLYNSLGSVYEMQGDQLKARAAYERALKLMETCKMNPDEAGLVQANATRFLRQLDNGAA